MPRHATRNDDLATIEARRAELRKELTDLDQRAKTVEAAARDAGRTVLFSALERIKIAGMDKADAKAIAAAIGAHGGEVVARHLATLPSA